MTRPTPRRHRHGGFTLIEMVASMAVLGVILLACGSIVAMATRATTDGNVRTTAQIQAADAAAQVTDDLNVALNFTQRTATAVTFTVPDRLNLGTPQAVTYSWAGTAGSPLTRQFNGGTAVTLLAGVQNFRLGYLTRTMGTATPAQQAVASHTTSTSLRDAPIDNKNYAAEYFAPSLPSGTTSYTLTRLRVQLKAGGGQDGAITVRVTAPPTLLNPTANVMATTTVYESALSTTYEYVDVPLTGLSGLSPSQTLCAVLSYGTGSSGQVCIVETDTSALGILGGACWTTSTNAGSTWSAASALTAPMFTAYGTVP